MGSVGIAELLVIVVVVGLPIWGVIDASLRRREDWKAAGRNRALWIAMQAVGIFFTPLGILSALIYLLAIRREVAVAKRERSSANALMGESPIMP